ncbi:hypothetical protein [uncultured Desulfosarcina sp.]|uniref:hypothetical protein n=1 Tax=uncultured Desulfosarcina sp. TaxID=218289 RepID=UPI0029C65BE2|nr:hypothetical protein [uncultured Desulfosarcina sp.]
MSTYGHIDFTLKPPYYGKLKKYEWVDDFLAVEAIREEMKFINSKIIEIMRTLSARESIKDRFKESFERYEQRRIERLSKILIKNQREPVSEKRTGF